MQNINFPESHLISCCSSLRRVRVIHLFCSLCDSGVCVGWSGMRVSVSRGGGEESSAVMKSGVCWLGV